MTQRIPAGVIITVDPGQVTLNHFSVCVSVHAFNLVYSFPIVYDYDMLNLVKITTYGI